MEKVSHIRPCSDIGGYVCVRCRIRCVDFTTSNLSSCQSAQLISHPANYKSAIDVYEGGPNIRTVPGFSDTASGGIFCTYPAEFMTKTGQFFSEFIASTILMFCIYSLQDNGNIGAGNLTPLGLFFVIFGIGACFGWETGYAINLARDFGPRLMSYFLGYGHEVWSAGNYYFWVPMVAPFCGTTFGGWLYDMFIFTGEYLQKV
jgi:aquaglyceroporin related protein